MSSGEAWRQSTRSGVSGRLRPHSRPAGGIEAEGVGRAWVGTGIVSQPDDSVYKKREYHSVKITLRLGVIDSVGFQAF